MKRILGIAVLLTALTGIRAASTLPVEGSLIQVDDTLLQYSGRVSFRHPGKVEFTYPGVQVKARFEGTSVRMVAKPKSGYFMVSVDSGKAFKVAFTGEKDSVVTLASALPQGDHVVEIMYAIEGYEMRPEFRGLVLDEGCRLLPLPERQGLKIEFVGNSITCGYGNESTSPHDPFDYATENHYYTYAAETCRRLGAQEQVIARSGIGVYRNYDGPREGTPEYCMPVQYEYTFFDDKSERWDFSRFTPDIVCVNLGTNDTSTDNYDADRLKQAYKDFLKMVRKNNPTAKIVFLTGSMMGGKELQLVRTTLDDVVKAARKKGDKRVYRFDFTPQDGHLGYGADWHPSIRQHQKMADELTPFLRGL